MAKQARRKAQQQKKNSQLFLWGGVALIILVAIIWIATGGSSTTGNTLPSEISVAEAMAKRDSGAFILDVRQPEEWNEAHIPDSTLIPLDQLPDRINELPKDQEIVVVCRSGNRSAQGRDILLEAGFTDVTSMSGGLNQWKTAGYPTVSGPQAANSVVYLAKFTLINSKTLAHLRGCFVIFLCLLMITQRQLYSVARITPCTRTPDGPCCMTHS